MKIGATLLIIWFTIWAVLSLLRRHGDFIMEIRFGPAGIPLSCKGRTLKDGIEDIHALELNAMEVQLVRPEGFDVDDLQEIGELAMELDVKLTVHAPYYIDLMGDDEIVRRSIDNIKRSAKMADGLDADIITTHIGIIPEDMEREEALERALKNIRNVRDWIKREKLSCKLGIETSGRQKVLGSLDEILLICKRVSNVVPVVNFAHVHAFECGSLKRKEDFQELLDRIEGITKSKEFYTHFSGVEHSDGNKRRCTPIKKGDMRFEPLAECILDNEDIDITIISGSPLLEHDAMYMKVILERVKAKREAKEAKEAKDGEEEEGE